VNIFSSSGQYALRATTYLAQQPSGTAVDVGALASALGVPRNYLSKVLSQLARTGLLRSSRGKRGGFSLGAPPDAITIYRVMDPFEHLDQPRRCLLGQAVCGGRRPCPAHGAWTSLSEHIVRFLKRTTLADLARGRTKWPRRFAGP
jgi:Rrf2 family protein